MSGQLFPAPASLESLTPRQRFVYDLLGTPRTAENVGMWLHAGRHVGLFGPQSVTCSCPQGRACRWCEEAGRAYLTVLRTKGLTIRRRSGLWERTDGSSFDSSQGEGIPF